MKAFKELLILTSFFGVIILVLIIRDDFYEDPPRRFVAKLPQTETTNELKFYETFRKEFLETTISTPFLYGVLNAYTGNEQAIRRICLSFREGFPRCLEGFYFYVYFRILSKAKDVSKVAFINQINELILGLKESSVEEASALGMVVRYYNIYLDHDMVYPLEKSNYKHQYFVEGWAFYNIALLGKWQDPSFICKKYMPKGFLFYCLWGVGKGISYFGDEIFYEKEIKSLLSYSFYNGVYGISSYTQEFSYRRGQFFQKFLLSQVSEDVKDNLKGFRNYQEKIEAESLGFCLKRSHVSQCFGFRAF